MEQGRQRLVNVALQRALTSLRRAPTLVQDLLLSVDLYRSLLLLAFASRHASVLAGVLRRPPPGGFEACGYFVDSGARQLLQFAALHALSTHLQSDEVLAPAQLLPQVSRVLLQSEEAGAAGGTYLEAVAGALASQMGADLLMVDALLLASLASATVGGPPEAYLSAFSGGGGGSGRSRGSAAQKLALAWLALRGALFALERPTVVFVRSAEQLLCSSFDARDAFMGAFGQDGLAMALEGHTSRAPLVILGGCLVNESAAALAGVRPQRQLQPGVAGGEDDEGEGGPRRSGGRGGRGSGGGLFGGGGGDLDDLGDDDLGLGDLLLSLSKLAGEQQRPNARRLLKSIFPTLVKLLQPPAGSAAAVRHQQRLLEDAAAAAQLENHRQASAVAASTGVAVPPKSSSVYAGAAGLSRLEWEKVLSWAVAMQVATQALQMQQQQAAEDERAEQQLQLEEAGAAQEAAATASEGEGECSGASSLQLSTPPHTGLRRRHPSGSPAQMDVPSVSKASPLAPTALFSAVLALIASVYQPLLQLALSAVQLPGRLASAAWNAAWELLASAASRLPLVGGLLRDVFRRRDMARMDAEMQRLQEELDSLQQLAAQAVATHAGIAAGPGSGGGSSSGGSGTLQLSEASLRYGLAMLKRGGGAAKASIEPSGRHERTLLSEVLAPEDCGAGFEEVGALAEAKAALREAVQLPLTHPELFAGSLLARPSKGVLLFGPPGTGKTLLARAAAAECGAAFLALGPSAVGSKWFGESTRLIRAAFSLATKLAPCVIFVDEVDSLLGRRNSQREHEALREMKNELMSQWDGIRPGRERVMLLGATNRPFDLDEAALRRFTHRIFIGLPDRAARADILRVTLKGERLAGDVDIRRLSEQTEGYSGADLKQLCVAAAMRPVRSYLEQESAAKAAEAAAAAAEAAEGAAAAAPAGEEELAPLDGQLAAAAAAGGLAGSDGEGGSGASTPTSLPAPSTGAAALPLVPRLGSLLRQAETLAAAPGCSRTDLRPIGMHDFAAALAEVGVSVDPGSATQSELEEWAAQWGTTGAKQSARSRRLAYYT